MSGDGRNYSSFVNQGNIKNCRDVGNSYFGCTFNNKQVNPEVDPHDHVEKKPAMNLITRWILSVISVLADLLGIVVALETISEASAGNTILYVLNTVLRGSTAEKLWFYFGIFVLIAAMFVTLYLIQSAIYLTFESRYWNLRRKGRKVFSVKPGRCPCCDSRLELIYEDGNYLRCKQSKKEHKWLISF